MQKRKLIAAAVAIALQTYYVPAIAAESTDGEKECPENASLLSKEKRSKLSDACLAALTDKDYHWGWIAGGVTALAAGVILGVHDSDSDANHQPTPPDDGGDTPTPPDDTSVVTYSNGVTNDKGADTLHFDDIKQENGKHLGEATLSYSEQDGQWQLATRDGKTLSVSGWHVTKDNALVIEGTQANGQYWKYDSRGYLILADENTTVVTGDGKTNTSDRDLNISGDRSTGVIISGNSTSNTLSGDATVTDGATGVVITGDNTTNTISGKTTVDGATGALISGNDTHTTFTGDLTVRGGGTGMTIDGDNVLVDNTGTSSISGAGSTGSAINGENAYIVNEGSVTVSDGATGSKISGDGAIVDNIGDITATGAGTTVLDIEGDNALIISEGNQSIAGGAAGLNVKGDNARVVNTGDIAVDGAGSTGTAINGNNAALTQNGDLIVTNGATGTIVNGEKNTVSNKGNATVRDENSVGFAIDGDNNSFSNIGNISSSLNGTGAVISGDASHAYLDGDINVTSAQDATGVYRGATGVEISANNSSAAISGNVNVTASFAAGETVAVDDVLTGVAVTGSNNSVDLEGTLTVNTSAMDTPNNQYLNNVIGLDVEGDGNTVNVQGGLNINFNEDGLNDSYTTTGIHIDGDSTVVLSGHSSVVANTILQGGPMMASVENGGMLLLDENSRVDITPTMADIFHFSSLDNAAFTASGEGSAIDNHGTITSHGMSALLVAKNAGTVVNSGNILSYTMENDEGRNVIMTADGENTVAKNSSGGTITVRSSLGPRFYAGITIYPMEWYDNNYYGMLAYNGGEVLNEQGASILLEGAGLYGVSASSGTALNAGNITVDGFQQQLDEAGNSTGENYWNPPKLYLTSAAMVAGSTDQGDSSGATAINTGTITVNNAGFGMTALNNGTAINQGTITLTADDGVTRSAENQLVGMAAFNGGTVINDTNGTINIEADYGKPFYTDSSSVVVNYGTVCVGGDCKDSAEYNPTDENVSLAYHDGLIADTGETTTLNQSAAIMGDVGNNGTVEGNTIFIGSDDSTLTNNNGGVINNTININAGTFNNEGTANAQILMNNGTLNNLAGGTVNRSAKLYNNAVVNNSGTWTLGYAGEGSYSSPLDISNNAVFNNSGELIINNAQNDVNLRNNGKLYNTGHIVISNAIGSGGVNVQDGTPAFINAGVVDATAKSVMASAADADDAFFWNQENGIVNYDVDNGKAVSFTHSNYVAQNDGTMNVSGNNAYGMYGSSNAQLVNNGTINLGTAGTTDTNMVAMALDANATADAVIENNGTININASNSWAFSVAGAGHVVNNGTVVIADGVTGSGLIKQGDSVNVEGANGNNGNATEAHYANYTLPGASNNNLSGYVVGTNADGSAGQLKVSNASMEGVGINTGFTAGTADTTVTFNNVVEGSNLTDADAIQSTSVVWNAQGTTDKEGNVDVTMTKNAYADVASDSNVSGIAQALDAGYTNNELYTSLNVSTTAELNSALKQISGSQATTVFREARILSNRFNMLADAAPHVNNGLAFNVVAKGDPRAELGNDTQYDMLALRQKWDLSENQNLALEYGIARLDGNGSHNAGDNGLTGGYSQFFGLKHSMGFGEGVAWNNSLRYDVHNLDSSRSVSYGDTSKVADSSARQQYMEFRSEGAKTFTLMDDALKVTPYAGVKFRHTLEDGYRERSAGDFNLTMNSGAETAVDSVVGLKLDYTGANGWSANATLEGGPNLSYSKSQRSASLQGAAGQSFSVDDGQKGGGVNGLATVGVKYSHNNTALHLDAYQWKEDSISDKGFMLNFKKTFR